MDCIQFEIMPDRLEKYLRTKFLIVACILTPLTFGIFAIFLIIFALDPQCFKRYANSISMQIDDEKISFTSRFSFRRWTMQRAHKSIPLHKVTHCSITQGPLLAKMDLWNLNIQTASIGRPYPELSVVGLKNPKETYDFIQRKICKSNQ